MVKMLYVAYVYEKNLFDDIAMTLMAPELVLVIQLFLGSALLTVQVLEVA